MAATFELQGHRGARGLKPENTLPSFEAALDAGVTSIETDVHLTRDGVPVLVHDATLSPRFWWCPRRNRSKSPVPDLTTQPLVSSLTLRQLREFAASAIRIASASPSRIAVSRRWCATTSTGRSRCRLSSGYSNWPSYTPARPAPSAGRQRSSVSAPAASSSTWN